MKSIGKKTRRLIRYYEKLTGSRDPLTIARFAGIGVAIMPLDDIAGTYMLLNRKRWIFVNEDISSESPFFQVVAAHELGHALLHRKENCTFMAKHTLLSTSRIEQEANRFASQLLITDDMLNEYAGCTQGQFCNATGYPEELIVLRLGDVI